MVIGHLMAVINPTSTCLSFSLVSIFQPFTKVNYQFIYDFHDKEKELSQDCKIQNCKK
jgi:hypothetical protein